MKPKVLLYVAWGMLLVSLFGPATKEPFILIPASHMRVGVMIPVSVFAAVASHERSGNVILIFVAIVCFLASPVVVNAPRRTFRRAMLLPVLAGALVAWVPVAVSTGYASDDLISLGSPMWGYYLFASALTVSSVGWAMIVFSGNNIPSVLDGSHEHLPVPWASESDEAAGQRGFPIVVADEQVKPPRDSDERTSWLPNRRS